MDYIKRFEAVLESQNPRWIKKARTQLEMIIEHMESYDPFAEPFEFDEFDEFDEEDEDIFEDNEEEDEESEDNTFVIEDGEKKWTS